MGEATRDFGVSKPAISRHLKVLEEAGTIVRVVDGRTHRLRIRQGSLQDASAWMDQQRGCGSESSTRSSSTCASSARTTETGAKTKKKKKKKKKYNRPERSRRESDR